MRKVRKPIKLESVFGIEGPVWVLPWSVAEFKTIGHEIESLKMDDEGIYRISQIVSARLVDELGASLGLTASDLESYDAPTLSDLFAQICERCGFSKRELIQKN